MPAVAPPDASQLYVVAYAGERAQARRLARDACLTGAAALQQLLQTVAQTQDLAGLVAARLQVQANTQARSAARKQKQALAWQRKQAARMPSGEGWTGWFDGSAWPNPGRIGLGARLTGPLGVVTDISLPGGHGDSNQAEYMALLVLLEAALASQADQLLIHGDSRIVIDDVTGVHRVANLEAYRCRALTILAQLGPVRFHWIPRRRNAVADALSLRGRQT
ncbi:MAG: ribonuclease HI family protein [Oxalobacteraceae bacterium]|nr:ribonuclease HI family protein [Oxalobacteraceae bacterium]